MDIARIHCTLQKLLARRGYTTPDPVPPTHFTVHRDTDNVTLLVYRAPDDSRVGVGVVRDLVKMMDEVGAPDSILLTAGTTSSATSSIHALMATGKFIVPIIPSSLLFDIFEHASVPHHRMLRAAEVEDLLKTRKLTLDQFPSIKMNDPMCRYLGGKPGDVFEITRNRPTVGYHLYYRKVVDGSLE